MRFAKWQALGNDYAIVEQEQLAFELTAERVRRLCAAHTGIGSDGVLLLSPSERAECVARVRIFNPDGSEAELSGNGVREAVLYLRRSGWTDADSFAVETAAGEIRPEITGTDTCRIDMGLAATRSGDFPSGGEDGRGTLEADDRRFDFQHVSIGNPQCAIEVDRGELHSLELTRYGPPIEASSLFPNRTNVSFWSRGHGGEISARIFERGVGETLSSGTGASGAAVAFVLAGGRSPVTVHLDGGDLTVEVASDLRIHLTGWARPVYAGKLSEEMVASLSAEGTAVA